MEIVNHEDEDLKSAADLALDKKNDVKIDEEAKKSFVITPLDEALANSRMAINTAEKAIKHSTQMAIHLVVMEELLLSKAVFTPGELLKLIKHHQTQAKELSARQVENYIKTAGGLSPDDTPDGPSGS